MRVTPATKAMDGELAYLRRLQEAAQAEGRWQLANAFALDISDVVDAMDALSSPARRVIAA